MQLVTHAAAAACSSNAPFVSQTRVLLGRVPDVTTSVDAQQTVSYSDAVVRRILLITKERVRQPQVIPLALRQLYLLQLLGCLLYTSPSPRDRQKSRMPSSA